MKSHPVPTDRVTLGPWAGFAAMYNGMFVAILDVQIVATYLPDIQAALQVNPDQMSWVQTAYLIAEVVAIQMTGPLMRVLTMRCLFVGSMVLFTLAPIGWAASGGFGVLLAWRFVQGKSGGTLIPVVFSAVFLLFPMARQGLATTVAGVLAVLAPTVGPVVGGWITQTYSWHWWFLINVLPGLLAASLAALVLPRVRPQFFLLRSLDLVANTMLALGLATLEIAMQHAPEHGWTSGLVLGLLALTGISMGCFVRRSPGSAHSVVDLRAFGDRTFAVGCLLSFVLGIGLFGSVYLMPVFLTFVRGQNAVQVGTMMLVTGLAQQAMVPVAVALEQRIDPRILTAAGFALFAGDLRQSAFQTPQSDYAQMFWPQVTRGLAVMFCLLLPTRMALGRPAPDKVSDANGLFNLMRNLGGAIGLARIDTVIYSRAAGHGADLLTRLQVGDALAARLVGLPVQAVGLAAQTLALQAQLAPLMQKAAVNMAINTSRRWSLS